MRVASENGNLIPVAVVAQVFPRLLDGRRLLRFFTGLAMLALAFSSSAFSAPALGEGAPPAPIVITASAQSGVVLEAAAAEIPAAVEPPMPAAPVTVPLIVLIAAMLIPAGLALRVRAERAPPAV